MIVLYSHPLSGNSYKARLFLSLLGLDREVKTVDLMKGEHKSPEYLAINPFGQVPALVDGEEVILDAQAILVYLARKYGNESWLPLDAFSLSAVTRWLSTTSGEIRQGPEFARLFHLFGVKTIDIEMAAQKSAFILEAIEQHLSDRDWLATDTPTIADIAAFPYIALAPDGHISLDDYPNIRAWIDRIRHLPGFVGMRSIPAPDTVGV
ncbi:glutathione S-transferase family protein [Synechococcus sp. PCC 7336]|uniref:glutathione S-transferase family protein n=1 Tax=Synechococcus sp. PCC 7336 TaxID=195250 RepID=UPI00034B06C5|nr:glutathione S-transferase [Synechococcus sp. PCC 7336]